MTQQKRYLHDNPQLKRLLEEVFEQAKKNNKLVGELAIITDPTHVYYFDMLSSISVIDHGKGNKPVQCAVCNTHASLRYEFRIECLDNIERGPVGSTCIFSRVLGSEQAAERFSTRMFQILETEAHKLEHQILFDACENNFDVYLERIGHSWLVPWQHHRHQVSKSVRNEINIAHELNRPLNYNVFRTLDNQRKAWEEQAQTRQAEQEAWRKRSSNNQQKAASVTTSPIPISKLSDKFHNDLAYRQYLGLKLVPVLDHWSVIKPFATSSEFKLAATTRYKTQQKLRLDDPERALLFSLVNRALPAIENARRKMKKQQRIEAIKQAERDRIEAERLKTERITQGLVALRQMPVSNSALSSDETIRQFIVWLRPNLRDWNKDIASIFQKLEDQTDWLIAHVPVILVEYARNGIETAINQREEWLTQIEFALENSSIVSEDQTSSTILSQKSHLSI